MNSAMSIKQRNKPGDNFQSPSIIGIVGVVYVSVHLLNHYNYNNHCNHSNEDSSGNQDSCPDVEAAGSRGVVSGTLQISSHLPVSSLGGQDHNNFLKEINAQHQGNNFHPFSLSTDIVFECSIFNSWSSKMCLSFFISFVFFLHWKHLKS